MLIQLAFEIIAVMIALVLFAAAIFVVCLPFIWIVCIAEWITEQLRSLYSLHNRAKTSKQH